MREVLLIPFHMNGNAVGTIWAVNHEPDRHFDAEHKRLLEDLSMFAASAYQVLVEIGELQPLLEMQPKPSQ